VSSGTVRFSKRGNAIAVIAGTALLAAAGYLVIISGFSGDSWATKCNSSHRLLVSLNCASNGWLGLAFFSGAFLFLLPLWVGAIRRLFAIAPAIRMAEEGLQVHPSFMFSDRLIRYTSIQSVTLTTEGAVMSSGSRGVAKAITPLGSRWIVSRSERKICALVIYRSNRERQKKLKISAQFIDRGKWALGDFVAALTDRIALEKQ
jgi:hypothetical protein